MRAILATNALNPISRIDANPWTWVSMLWITKETPIPEQIPLVFDHKRSIRDVVGSAVDLRVELLGVREPVAPFIIDEPFPLYAITGELQFSRSREGYKTRCDIEDGHIRFMSIGIEPDEGWLRIGIGERKKVFGMDIKGPVIVAHSFRLIEATPTFEPRDWNCKILFNER